MATLTIDGKACTFEGKQTILQVALDNGIEIPHYCYHPGLSVVASCRICLAEVAQPNPRNEGKVELVPKLLPTCQTPAADGMEVYTQSPKAVANQKAVMEYLLINHPLDCPVCDQAGECYLQDYSYRYGRAESRFEEDKIKQATKDLGPHVKLYADRCIMCSRCVRFTKEVTGTGEIGVFGRGNREEIDVFPGKPLDNELSANVVDICPVGALLDKDFLFTRRVWELKRTASIDGITASGDNLWIEHADDRIYRVKPRANPQVNQWWISDEIRYGWKFVQHEDRLANPKRSQLGAQVDCNWDKALDDAARLLKTTARDKGSGSLALLASPMLASEEAYLLARLVRGLDPEALLAIGPVPFDDRYGRDEQDRPRNRTFPGGYTVYAEKAPNARGVRRALEQVAEGAEIIEFDGFVERLADKAGPVTAAVVTGNYPSKWTTKELTGALRSKAYVLLDVLPNDLTAKAEVLLPAATWAEKAGCFENAQGRLQAFDRAVTAVETARPEGQSAIDLLVRVGLAQPARYDAGQVRQAMGGVFADVQLPADARTEEPDLVYAEL
jgi:NADH-quinone oxidoreductase subunit G